MKKHTLLALSLLLFSVVSFSQQIPNGSFENWSTMSFFDNPAGYYTTNFQSYLMLGFPNVTKTTDAHTGSFAAKLETVGIPPDLLPAGIFLGQAGPGGITGGIPYNERPDSVRFYAKYNLNAGDTAMMLILFQLMGGLMAFANVTLTGDQATYAPVTAEINWFIPDLLPDTVALVIFSSSPQQLISSGNTLYIDDIKFLGVSQQLPNNGFENWVNLSAETPDNWSSSNPYTIMGSGVSVNKSTEHFDGLYSALLTNEIGPQGDTLSYITNGFIGGDGPDGGTPLTENPSKFSFYYKYQPVGSDSALAMALLWRWDQASGTSITVDSALVRLGPQTTWTYYEIPFNFNGTPPADTVTVAFAGGDIDQSGGGIGLGSKLWVDNVYLDYGPIGISEAETHSPGLYPNPAKNEIVFPGNAGQKMCVEILSPDGKLVKSFELLPGSTSDVSDLVPGYYIYRIYCGSNVTSGKFIKIN